MGSAYEQLSREQLLAVVAEQSARLRQAAPMASDPPSSGDRYRQLVHEAADGIFVSDQDGTYVEVNDVGARILGMSPQEIVGKRVSDFVVETQQAQLSEIRQRVRDGEWSLREWQVRRKDGVVITVEVSGKLLADGRIHGIWRDVSARKIQEEALRQSEQRFRALTAGAFEGLAITERGIVVDVNDQLAHLLGYDRAEMLGKHVSTLVAPESREALSAAMGSGREAPYRHVVLRKDGTRIEVEAQSKQIEWFDRSVRVTAIRDVREAARIEERLSRVHKLEALGRLAGGIAHDFNNILLAIFSYTDLIDLDAEDPDQIRTHVEGLRAASQRARELVQQILAFSRQKGEGRRPMTLGPVITETAKFLRSTLPSTIDLRIDVEPTLPEILGSSVQLHQVLMNLCVNASHAMPQGGVLSVRATQLTGGPELLLRAPDLVESKRYVVITVRDTGQGMTLATMSRIFEPFFTTKTNGDGSGLGLAVVHGIVKAHDGAIAVDSVVGQGTAFDVYLPAHG